MATPTTRAALLKPTYGEDQDVEVLNANYDKIDLNLGAQPVTSGTMPSAPYNGQVVRQTDTGAIATWDSANSQWVYVDTQWQSYTPKIATGTSGGTPITIGNGVLEGGYMRTGKIIRGRIYTTIGTTTSYPSGIIFFGLPFEMATGEDTKGLLDGKGDWFDATTGNYELLPRVGDAKRLILTNAAANFTTPSANLQAVNIAVNDRMTILFSYTAKDFVAL